MVHACVLSNNYTNNNATTEHINDASLSSYSRLAVHQPITVLTDSTLEALLAKKKLGTVILNVGWRIFASGKPVRSLPSPK